MFDKRLKRRISASKALTTTTEQVAVVGCTTTTMNNARRGSSSSEAAPLPNSFTDRYKRARTYGRDGALQLPTTRGVCRQNRRRVNARYKQTAAAGNRRYPWRSRDEHSPNLTHTRIKRARFNICILYPTITTVNGVNCQCTLTIYHGRTATDKRARNTRRDEY